MPDKHCTVYGLANCSTCRSARRWLENHGVSVTFIDYRKTAPDAATVLGWKHALGGWDQLINKRSRTWRELDPEVREVTGDAAITALLQTHPTLMRRPLVTTTDGRVSTGFSDEDFRTRFMEDSTHE